MFAKLIKHEWRASRGLVGLLCAIIGISGLLFGGISRYMTWSSVTGNDFMVAAYAVILTVSILAIVGCSVGSMYLLVYQFYKSRFTDQGYLMLTLPVTTHQQLLSSIVNTVRGVILVGLTSCFAIAVGLGIFLLSFDQEFSSSLLQAIANAKTGIAETSASNTGLAILYLLSYAVMFLADILLLMLACTVGAQATRHPVLKGAALYIVTDMLLSEINLFVSPWVNAWFGVTGPGYNWLCIFLLYGTAAVISYFTMHHILDKKLNLV